MNKLSLDFLQDRDLEAITAKVLVFLKDNAVDSGTLFCVIHGAGNAGGTAQYRHLLAPDESR